VATGKTIGMIGVGLAAAAGFVVLFGSPVGAAGALVESVPIKLKTKVILSLSIFGFVALASAIFISVWPPKKDWRSDVPIFTLIAAFISFFFGFGYQDCMVFTFCDDLPEM